VSARRLVVNLRDARPVYAIPDWALEEIRAALPPNWSVAEVSTPADGRGDGGRPTREVLDAIEGAEVYLGYGFPPPLFEAARTRAPALRWVHSAAAGVGGSLFPEMIESELVLTNSAGVHAEPIADTVLAMILYFTRGLDFALAAQARREWDKSPFEAADTPVREVGGGTLGVIGYGGIGRAVARRGSALGMEVLALKRTPGHTPAGIQLLFGPDGLAELLERSDVVAVCLPETSATRGLLGAEELARMRREAVLINVARGGVVDEEALVAALRARRIRGAGLDVFREEPLPADSPFWSLPNVLVTPHVSGTSRGFWRREVDLIVGNLERYLRGRPLRNVVDKRAGY
jgi:phosphoglycerate dehydrogenase-like enzyme